MRFRTWALAALAWIAVVLVGSEITWLAIDHAGQQVSGTSVFAAVTPSPTPTSTPTRPTTPKPSHRSRPRPKPGRPSVTSYPSYPTYQPPIVVPPPSRTPVPAKAQVGSWSGAAGSVTASCSGQTAHLIGASPNNGWQVQPGDVSGSSLEVQFTKPGAQVQVQATCQSGAPVFQVDSSGSGDN